VRLKPATLATTRLAEHWAHGLDITRPLGIAFPDTARLRRPIPSSQVPPERSAPDTTVPATVALTGIARPPPVSRRPAARRR
jgi:hypothetical protein